MRRIIALSAMAVTLCSAQLVQAQTAPPPPPAAPAAAPKKQPKASSSVTVTRSGGCVSVKVCPGPAATPAPPPAATPAPPPPPPAHRVAPPPPLLVCPLPPVAPKKRLTLKDPARTRLALSGTAEVLGHREWEVASRGIVGLLEVSLGLGGMFQISIKTSPVMWFIPDLKLADSLWAGELKVQLVNRPAFKLAADLTYFRVAELNGLKTGLSAKVGDDRLALHLGLGTVLIFPPKMASDTCAGPVASDGYDVPDCGGGSERAKPVAILTANIGLEARFWRYGKFFLEGFMAHFGEGSDTMTLLALVPGVRFHGSNFAADLGLGILTVEGAKIPFPVVNLSYRW